MKTVYITVGLPASGKTTWAKGILEQNPGAYKRVNKDDLRAMLDCGKWSRDNEDFVLKLRDHIVGAALDSGKHVIVDDTNLAPKHQTRLRQLAREHGAVAELVDFTQISPEECIERDRKRPNYVGEKVIRSMWRQFLAPEIKLVVYDPALPNCIIVDVDGTIALMNGRGPFEWQRVGEDLPNQSVCGLIRILHSAQIDWQFQLMFFSARDACCAAETDTWIRQVFGRSFPLHMRPAGDMRDDRIIKREIYEREINGKYNVLFVLDDRDKVVKQWREMGLPCFQVAEGDF